MKIFYEPSPDPRVIFFNELISREFPQFLQEKEPDLILVAGGDGALHHATKRFPNFSGIYFGKGLGTLNFLMNTFDNDIDVLNNLSQDKLVLHTVTSATIAVSLNNNFLGNATNDLVLGDTVNGYHEYSLSTSDHSFDNFSMKGTGLCLATPLGSTGYNFNNNGVIIPLDSTLWSLTGIVCNKYINDVIKAQPSSIWATGGSMYIDGINAGEISKQDTLNLKAGDSLRIGFLDEQNFMSRRIELANRMRKGSI